MLNLNYNIIGSNQPFVDRGNVSYKVRPDAYSASIVLALPGSTFESSQFQNLYGMQNAWDDISSYIRGGSNTNPIGSNLSISVSQSLDPLSGSIYPTASTYFGGLSTQYKTAMALNGISSLVTPDIWSGSLGVNLSFSRPFVIESYVAWNDAESGSISQNLFVPRRNFLYKYYPGDSSQTQYLWDGCWGGDADPGTGANYVSGSSRFAYTSVDIEKYLYATQSFDITPNQWRHYALVYTLVDPNDGSNDRTLKLYMNGVKVAQTTIGVNEFIPHNPSLNLQIFGAVDGTYSPDASSGSLAWFNDFKIYNGTDKGYTGNTIPLPPSMIEWVGV